MKISLIAVVDEQFGLGKENALLCYLPADLQHFKQLTMGKPIVMGRKTFDSIGKPLPGRMNIVISHQRLNIEGVTVVDSLDKAFELTKNFPEVMVIGGASIYQQTFLKAQIIYLTKINAQLDADVFFPQIDEAVWFCEERTARPKDLKNQYDLTFYQYVKRE